MKTTVKLSDRVIERLKPQDGRKQYDVFDKQTGLGLCCSNGGARTWFIFWRDNAGKSHRKSIGRYDRGMTVEQARDAAVTLLKEARAGVDVKHTVTVGELLAKYLEHARMHLAANTFAQVKLSLDLGVDESLRAAELNTVDREKIEQLHHDVGQTRGTSAANHLLANLKRVFSLGRAWKMLRGENPATGIEQFKRPLRERYLTRAELLRLNESLLAEGDWRFREFYPLLLSLGMRKSELMKMTWDRIDFDAHSILLRRTKNGKQLTLPLSEPVAARLRALPSYGCDGHLFPGNISGKPLSNINDAWQRIRSRAGIPDVRPHDLRHSFASFNLQAGVPLPVISRLMNHSSLQQTMRYAHAGVEQLRTPMEAHSAFILGDPTPGNSVAQEPGSTESSEILPN